MRNGPRMPSGFDAAPAFRMAVQFAYDASARAVVRNTDMIVGLRASKHCEFLIDEHCHEAS